MGDITGRSITRTQVSLSRPACAPEALLGRSNIGQGKCRDTERICFTAVPAVCEVASCYEHVWGGRTCPGVLIVAGPPFFSEKCSFLAALTYLSFSHCVRVEAYYQSGSLPLAFEQLDSGTWNSPADQLLHLIVDLEVDPGSTATTCGASQQVCAAPLPVYPILNS